MKKFPAALLMYHFFPVEKTKDSIESPATEAIQIYNRLTQLNQNQTHLRLMKQ
jgi:hypothetical protein